MMQHYLKTKEEYKDCILFYRLGDFYEMFFEDAKTVSRELELTLTGKNCGVEERAPMCGVPFHSAEIYISRLVEKGYKVAICEQVEDPKLAKGIVKREVIRIVTSGTNLNMEMLDEKKNNYLMCIYNAGTDFGMAVADITTGAFDTTEVDSFRKLMDEINRYMPSEIICNKDFSVFDDEIADLKNRLQITVSNLENWYFNKESALNVVKEHFHVLSLEGIGLNDYPFGSVASGALLKYLYETQKTNLSQMTTIHPFRTGKYMIIDSSTRRNLELVETMREKQKRGSLLWVLDKTKTAMGARTLRSFIEQPLRDMGEINQRLDAIEAINNDVITRDEIREYLSSVYDLERLMTRVTYQTANPRDLIAFRDSVKMLRPIKQLLKEFDAPLIHEIDDGLDTLDDIYELIYSSIDDDPPLQMHDGGILKTGFNEEIDKLRVSKTEGKGWLADLENREREKTGIKNLKIKYNKVFGYYLEVTNSFLNQVPDYFTRKQTLTNAERFITPELKELEDMILGAEDKLVVMEYDIFSSIREQIAKEVIRIQNTAKAVAMLDTMCSLAYVAEKNHYCRPRLNEEGYINIKSSRHPVVENMIENDMFIPNDILLDNKKNRIAIITGPNMAGKSTYMRQAAIIVLMAQLGSFIPAEDADIGIVDRIFTRVGASDDLASGQSTFMVEMTEVANILRNATSDSLLILDEIGRGTSTFDGLSIAWAVIEYIADPNIIGAKTLFATHYHELTELEGKLENVNNYCIAVSENNDDIVFLRKIIKGGADRSYGIQVAKLAGLPKPVLSRAREISNNLNDNDYAQTLSDITVTTRRKKKPAKKQEFSDNMQLSLFGQSIPNENEELISELKNIDLSNITPMDALNKLYDLQKRIK
ncbi:MAG: DNA mismatch repair protein MutS [Lachnospiraceae bacterium]|nr:DNA mismatch repair protein MutS [Lachnospiraceae bacterium]